MKKLLLMAALAGSVLAATAQSALTMKVDGLMGKKDYVGAAKVLNDEIDKVNAKWEKDKIKNPAALPNNSKLAEIYNKLGDVYGIQFNPELMKAAQGQPLDTAKFCTMLDKTVESYTQSAICDNTPDAKGKVKPKFNTTNRKQLLAMLDYFYYSGVFKNQNQDIKGSRDEFRKFVNLRRNPAFTQHQQDSIYQAKKKLYDQAAFNISLLYYQDQDWDNVLATIDDAMNDQDNLHDAFIIKQQALLAKGDSTAWIATLRDAVNRVENNTNFMEQLIYYYSQKNDAASANQLADELIATNPNNKTAWYMKGCTQLNLEQDYVGCRTSFQKCLDIDPDYIEANLNMAFSYMNEVMQNRQNDKYKYAFRSSYTSKEKAAYEKELAEIQGFYRSAMPYAEKVRTLVPDQPKRWGPALSMIYSNLRMQKEADEVDALISAANK